MLINEIYQRLEAIKHSKTNVLRPEIAGISSVEVAKGEEIPPAKLELPQGQEEKRVIPGASHYKTGKLRDISMRKLSFQKAQKNKRRGQDPARPLIKPCPICGGHEFWENTNGVISCVKCLSPYNKWAVLRYWKIIEGGQVMEVEYEHDYEKARQELFRYARSPGRWQVGSLQYKLLQLIPWEYGRDTPPGEAEFNSIWQSVCELFPQEKQRIPALSIFKRKLKGDNFNNTLYRQSVITKLMEKAKVPVIESGENPF